MLLVKKHNLTIATTEIALPCFVSPLDLTSIIDANIKNPPHNLLALWPIYHSYQISSISDLGPGPPMLLKSPLS